MPAPASAAAPDHAAPADLPVLLAGPFPHDVGDGVHARIHELRHPEHPEDSPAAALVIDLRGEVTDDDFADDEFLAEMVREGYVLWKGGFAPVALPEAVPGRVWVCADTDAGVPGVAWQTSGPAGDETAGRLTVVLFPDISDEAAFDEWLHVDDDWLACLFPALFAPEAPEAYVGLDEPHPRAERSVEEMTSALSRLDEAATLLAARALQAEMPDVPLGEALGLLGWAGAGHPGDLTPALIERHGAAAGRYAFEWHRRGYSEADRTHFTEWLTDEDELLLWRTDGGTRLEELTRWLDGAEPILHGMESSVLVHTVLASCRWDTDTMWTAEQIRRAYDRGLTNPNWWGLFGDGYLRERPQRPADIDAETHTLINYVLAWAAEMPLDAAIWYIAHQTPRSAAAAAFATGEFSPAAFVTMWALAPAEGWDEVAYQREMAQEPGWAVEYGLLVPVARFGPPAP